MFRPRTTGWIGFDVGSSSAKAAQVVRRDGKFLIASAAIVPRRLRWLLSELTAEEPRATADELQAAAAICDGLVGRTAAAVPSMALCEAVQIDFAPQQQRPDELAASVEAELHQSLSGYVLGSWLAPLQNGKCNVIATPEAWSDQVSADLAAGSWNCRHIESLPWALARAVTISDAANASRTVAALDWGSSRATLSLIHHGCPAMVRCLKDCGFQEAVAAVSRRLRVPERDAERILRAPGPCGQDQATAASGYTHGPAATALVETVDRLLRELRRTFSYWQAQSRGVRPEVLYLLGGGASLSGLATTLREALEFDVQLWSLDYAEPASAPLLPPPHLLAPALAASALAWEAS